MRILVTGGTGNVGRAAVQRLVEHGHQVRVIGRRADLEIEGAEYQQCDITDFDGLRQQVAGMEGIVHLAAIAYPGGAPGQKVFRVNCTGTFNVYSAAADEGIAKISSASSIRQAGHRPALQRSCERSVPQEGHRCAAWTSTIALPPQPARQPDRRPPQEK